MVPDVNIRHNYLFIFRIILHWSGPFSEGVISFFYILLDGTEFRDQLLLVELKLLLHLFKLLVRIVRLDRLPVHEIKLTTEHTPTQVMLKELFSYSPIEVVHSW